MIVEPVKEVTKPWGGELWIAVTEHYALKMIWLNQGQRSSLQYHEHKHEHIYVESGQMKVETIGPEGTLIEAICGPGAIIENKPGELHRVEALEDVRLFEVQTPFLDDVVRVEDDYKPEERA